MLRIETPRSAGGRSKSETRRRGIFFGLNSRYISPGKAGGFMFRAALPRRNFAERIAALKAAAETVMAEAQRMAAAARKFDKRREQKASRQLRAAAHRMEPPRLVR